MKTTTSLALTITAVACGAGGAGTPAASPTVGTVQAPDGVEISYEVAGTGEPTLVFVHGWSCDRTYWRDQLDHFARSHRVVGVDLGGHGESGLGREDWTMEAFGGDVGAVIEALDLEQVVLVGHSMGGPVVVEAAQLLPDRVVAILAIDTFQDVEQAIGAEERAGYASALRADFPGTTAQVVRQFMFAPGTDSALVRQIVADMGTAPPDVGISALEHLLTYDEGPELAATAAPIGLINADLTPTDLEAARQYKPDLSLTVMPGVGHFLMMEEPEEFNRLLARAVRDLTTAPAATAGR